MNRSQEFPILLFLLLGWLPIWAAQSTAHTFPLRPRIGEARWTYLRPDKSEDVFPVVEILPSPMISDPAIRACWAPFKALPGCSFSLFQSARSNNGMEEDLSPACCDAVLRMTPDCFYKIFFTSPFNRDFGPAVKGYCASQHP